MIICDIIFVKKCILHKFQKEKSIFDGVLDVYWRDGRVAEGGGLLNRYIDYNLYRGFESLSLRFGM